MKLKNIFLVLSLIAFAVGFNSGDSIYLGVGLPVGAILFCLFMIFTALEKESALLDEQRRAAVNLDCAMSQPVSPEVKKNTDRDYYVRLEKEFSKTSSRC